MERMRQKELKKKSLEYTAKRDVFTDTTKGGALASHVVLRGKELRKERMRGKNSEPAEKMISESCCPRAQLGFRKTKGNQKATEDQLKRGPKAVVNQSASKSGWEVASSTKGETGSRCYKK